MAAVNTENILSCHWSRTFWISWENGGIEVGSGELQTHLLVAWVNIPDMYDIQGVGVSSWDNNYIEWEIPQDQGKYDLNEFRFYNYSNNL